MKLLIPIALSISALYASQVAATTLEEVMQRGVLYCGVKPDIAGFSKKDAQGKWAGFDVDICRAVAAAIFGDADKVKYFPLSAKERFEALTEGKIDLLSRTTTWTYSRDTSLGVNYAGINYYDGQGFMVPKSLGVNSAKGLNGASICYETSTTTEINLAEYFESQQMTFESVPVGTATEAHENYLLGRCDAYTADSSALAARRSRFESPQEHFFLPEIISKEPLGPVVRHGDDQWLDIVTWSFNVMVAAEEMGITSQNLDQHAANTKDPRAQALLGVSQSKLGVMLGLQQKWAYNIIKQVGNYGESFERNLGINTPLKLDRGINALWTHGGIQYSPPLR